jgi:hypothetical protein
MADDPLGLTELLARPFWVPVKSLGRDGKGVPIIRPGQLVLAHQVYPPKAPTVIEIRSYDARDESKTEYGLVQLRGGVTPITHPPIKALNLAADEQMYVMYGKKRPGLVLQTINADYFNRLYPEPYAWIAPAFTFKRKHDLQYRSEIAAMERANMFFLPADANGMAENSVLRFEHIQPVAAAGIEPIFVSRMQEVFLSEDAWAILQHQLHRFCTGRVLDAEIEETIGVYRQYVRDALKQATG